MFSCTKTVAFLVLILCYSSILSAKHTSNIQAQKVVRGWLKSGEKPLGASIGREIAGIATYVDANQEPVYYIVNLRPAGFVIVPADDEIEPIIGFVNRGGVYDPSPENPLGALVSRDLPARIAITRGRKASPELSGRKERAKNKWATLQLTADSNTPLSSSAVSDIRVNPLLQSQWDQETVCNSSTHCYDYYTNFSGIYYPCGCVATAMAQLMRFYTYPAAGIGKNPFTIYVNGSSKYPTYTRGGDGNGGPYVWSQMALVPGCDTNDTQCAAIGALCYDAGVSVYMQYTANSSGAYIHDASTAMINTFYYANAVMGGNESSNIGSGLTGMINPNLDAGFPVLLGISGSVGGHAIIADGYGYNSTTLYHHLNMGWSGLSDAWYNLPNIDAYYTFTIVDSCIYNIFVTGSGEIISGRVTTSWGAPISGATVTAQATGTPVYTATTNSQGIYALTKVISSRNYTVSASKTGYGFLTTTAAVGLSQYTYVKTHHNSGYYSWTVGNVWAVNFTNTLPQSPIAQNGSVQAVGSFASSIILNAGDDGQPNPPGRLTYIITSLPQHGKLSDPAGGLVTANALPYTLANYGNGVNYLPCVYYTGADSFNFKANDGGTPPSGGDSNIAAVTINVSAQNPPVTPLAGDFNQDCTVDFSDLVTLISAWLAQPGDANWNPACDISTPADNVINMLDFAALAENWLKSM